MILIEQYDVLEKPIKQKFEKCGNEGSTLFITRHDVVAFFFVRLATKKAIVRCNETGKIIQKKYWNDETVLEAKKLLDQHKTPKLGYYLLALIFIGILIGISQTIIRDQKSTLVYENSFIAKSQEEQSQILRTLGEGDLIQIDKEIYRIRGIEKDYVILERSEVILDPNNIFKPIDESLIPNDSYKETLNVKKEDFYLNRFYLNDNYVRVSQYLDK